MAQKKFFDSDSFHDFVSDDEAKILDTSNPTLAGVVTAVTTVARNYNELHMWGSGAKTENGEFYVPGVEALKNAAMTSDNRGEAMEALNNLMLHLKATQEVQPKGEACDCQTRIAAAKAEGNDKLVASLRFQCIEDRHHVGWWNRPKAMLAGFNSRINPRWVLQMVAILIGGRYWKNQYGSGIKDRHGCEVSIKEIIQALEADEPNYRPKESNDSKKMGTWNRTRNRKDNEPEEGQATLDIEWRTMDNYEVQPELELVEIPVLKDGEQVIGKDGLPLKKKVYRPILEPRPDVQPHVVEVIDKGVKRKEVQLLSEVVTKRHFRRDPEDRFIRERVFRPAGENTRELGLAYRHEIVAHNVVFIDGKYHDNGPIAERRGNDEPAVVTRMIEDEIPRQIAARYPNVEARVTERKALVAKDLNIVRNQRTVQAWTPPELKLAKPLIQIDGISNQYGSLKLRRGKEGGWEWASENFTMPAAKLAWMKATAAKELLSVFEYGHVQWGPEWAYRIERPNGEPIVVKDLVRPGNRVSLDGTRHIRFTPGKAWKRGNVKGLNIPIPVQERRCVVCKCSTFHARDNLKIESHLDYKCRNHETSPGSNFWGKTGQLKCLCCGMVANRVSIPFTVRLDRWTLKVSAYGRFAEEVLSILYARHHVEVQAQAYDETMETRVVFDRESGHYKKWERKPTAWERIMQGPPVTVSLTQPVNATQVI